MTENDKLGLCNPGRRLRAVRACPSVAASTSGQGQEPDLNTAVVCPATTSLTEARRSVRGFAAPETHSTSHSSGDS